MELVVYIYTTTLCPENCRRRLQWRICWLLSVLWNWESQSEK